MTTDHDDTLDALSHRFAEGGKYRKEWTPPPEGVITVGSLYNEYINFTDSRIECQEIAAPPGALLTQDQRNP